MKQRKTRDISAAGGVFASSISLRGASICLALLAAGCPGERRQASTSAASRPSVALRVLVVNEPSVAEAVNRLRGEWMERSRGDISAVSTTWKELAAANQLGADVVIFPSRYMGELCVRGWLQPVRARVLEGEEFNVADLFPLVRRQLMRWGGQTMALPLGIYPAAAQGAPDAHPGVSLLAFVGPDVVSGEGDATVFNAQTLKPRITESPFVKALQQLASGGSKRSGNGTNFAQSIVVFGFADPMIAVSAETRNGASASKLVAWLASAEIGTQLADAAGAPLPVRRSVPVPATAFGSDPKPAERTKFANTFANTMNGDKCLLVPRIAGVDDYMATLDAAVNAAIKEKVSAESAIKKAADDWEQITNRYGREKQRDAYLKHLNAAE